MMDMTSCLQIDVFCGPVSGRRVQAMCLYATEIAAGDRPGPYTDELAEQYADRAIALRSSNTRRGRRRSVHPQPARS